MGFLQPLNGLYEARFPEEKNKPPPGQSSGHRGSGFMGLLTRLKKWGRTGPHSSPAAKQGRDTTMASGFISGMHPAPQGAG